MSIETPSTPEQRDIRSMTLDELREEADRLLTLYQATKDPDEMLDLSTRYTKIDMLIDDHEAQSKAGHETAAQHLPEKPDDVETTKEVVPDAEPDADEAGPIPDGPQKDESQILDADISVGDETASVIPDAADDASVPDEPQMIEAEVSGSDNAIAAAPDIAENGPVAEEPQAADSTDAAEAGEQAVDTVESGIVENGPVVDQTQAAGSEAADTDEATASATDTVENGSIHEIPHAIETEEAANDDTIPSLPDEIVGEAGAIEAQDGEIEITEKPAVAALSDSIEDALPSEELETSNADSRIEQDTDDEFDDLFSQPPMSPSQNEFAEPDAGDAAATSEAAIKATSESAETISGDEHDTSGVDALEETAEETPQQNAEDAAGESAADDVAETVSTIPSIGPESETPEESPESVETPENGVDEVIEEQDDVVEEQDKEPTTLDDAPDSETSELAEGLTSSLDDASSPTEDLSDIGVQAETGDDAEPGTENDDTGSDFEDALASLTAALDKSPDPDSAPDIPEVQGPSVTPTTGDVDSTGASSSSDTQQFDSNDDLMDQLNTIKPGPGDALFDIDSVSETDEASASAPDENVVHIVVDTNDDTDDPDAPEAVSDQVEDEDAAATVDTESISAFPGTEPAETPVKEKSTSFGGLDNVPLPQIAPLSGSTDQKSDPAATIPAIPSFQDPAATIPAIPSFQDLVDQEKTPETHPQAAAPSSQDTIPMSVSEGLPKFDLTETQRICAHCGQITALTEETCNSCSYSDASLGILNSIVAGDAQQTARLLNAKPAVIHTITSRHAWTLLHMAASGGNARLVDLLLRRGSHVNAQNVFGKTALHYASLKGHVQIVGLLLDNNADLSILFEGKSALEHAAENNQLEVVKLLKTKAPS